MNKETLEVLTTDQILQLFKDSEAKIRFLESRNHMLDEENDGLRKVFNSYRTGDLQLQISKKEGDKVRIFTSGATGSDNPEGKRCSSKEAFRIAFDRLTEWFVR